MQSTQFTRIQLALMTALALAQGCAATSHKVAPSKLGAPVSISAVQDNLNAGPIEFERIVAADWAVDRSGLVNFDNAKAEHLEDELEQIQIYVYRITHPEFGTYLIDTGISADLADGDSEDISGMVASAMNADKLVTHVTTADLVSRLPGPLKGVFLTHMHLDHIFGLPDIGNDVPVYVGPGEADHSAFLHMFVQGTTDSLLDGKGALREWAFDDQHPAIDVFGDGSLWALHMPGHSPGSVAFVIRTTTGPVLLTGDTCHTGFGWREGIEPGNFTDDHEQNRASLVTLKTLAKANPTMQVYLGHQEVDQKLRTYGATQPVTIGQK